ncbi:ubiquitin carboxyl-terminal hydrolase 17 [Lactuca sativa]|uniref:ubiquitinyl hydrolase 1 n=1 Tax=Lactuca sativa TaxID=4236 RepID=A0A9R1WUW4_LACSA|nr:ubiquitin carboxyl-terminal hydrolase 17 [Lactuca sativa]KAJ0186452.1 hypothetical protein LSAT_V11C900487040 [Lactuca sativa]
MLVGRDLGLPNLVVLVAVFVIFPVIGFVIRRKLQHAAARNEEIKKLLILASEEAARAEIEATEGYFFTTNTHTSIPSPDSAWVPAPESAWVPAPESAWVPAPESAWVPPKTSVPIVSSLKPPYQCAVCFSPTSTRCAKCKAVRYCSGRCQIVHWRQGHRDECKPYVAVKPTKDVSDNSINKEDDKDSNNHSPNANLHEDSHQPETNSFFQSASESSTSESSTFSTPTRSSTETFSVSSLDSDNFVSVKSDISPSRKSTDSNKINQTKFNLSNEDTTSSDFWSGPIHSKKSTIDHELDGFETSGYNNVKGVTVNPTDNPTPNGFGTKKSTNETSSSNEILTTRSPLKISPSVEHSTDKESKAFSSMQIPEKSKSKSNSNDVFNNKSFTSPAFKSSKASATHLTSSTTTNRLVSQTTKPVVVHDEKNRVATATATANSSESETVRSGLKTSMLKVVDQFKPSKLTRQCSPRAESETAHRYNCKGLFSYEMFVKLYNWKQVELRPFGLVNCGNSCYANAVLQCLTYTPPLNAYLLQGLHSKTCNKREWCFTCEFEALILKSKGGNSPLSPIRILENIGSNLGHGKEEDAHEFLRYAIDTLQSACLKEAGIKSSNSLEEETTLIGLTFGGYLRSKIKCMKCGGKSERHERMMDLTVEIEGDIATLEEALDKFTCTEVLDGENKYKCSRCKSYEKAKKKLTLLEAPNVLTIALKRFQSGKFGKLNKPIHFPEILDMAPYVSGTSDKSPVYRLYGVVVHVDIMNAAFSGHYVCYVKNIQNRWFKIDDSRVKEVDLQSVLMKGAYLLLYARCSPRAPRIIRSLISRHNTDPKKHKITTTFTKEPWDMRNNPPIRHRTLEEESSSSSDSSGIFSESCSCSTESSNRDSTSIEDHINPWEWEHEYNINNKSDVDTSSSSSSSSSSPSPLYSRKLPGVLYDENVWGRSSNSCRETNFDRLGGRPTLRRSTTHGRSEK